jgi:uncharacterized protein
MKNRQKFVWARLGLTCLTLVACMGCAALQRRLLYFPGRESPAVLDRMAKLEGLMRWQNSDGQDIGWKRLSSLQPAQGRVLITHGNGGNAVERVNLANPLQKAAALDVYLLEYPGYGDRSGSPSESALFKAADLGLESLPTNGPIYLLGESLGTGVASYLAGQHPDQIAGVLLVAPFDNLTDLVQHHLRLLPACWLLREHYTSDEHLRNYCGPVAILVGGKDRMVPEKFGLRLFDGYAGPKRLWRIPKASHKTIHEPGDAFWNELVGFWHTNHLDPESGQSGR